MRSLTYALLIILFIIPISFALYHGPKYTYRVFVWQGADYDDYLRFSKTQINSGDKTFQFYQGSKMQMDQFKFDLRHIHWLKMSMRSWIKMELMHS